MNDRSTIRCVGVYHYITASLTIVLLFFMFVLWFYLNKTKTILLTCDVERKILEIGVLYLGKYRPRYDIRTESNLFSDIVPWSILGLGDGLVFKAWWCYKPYAFLKMSLFPGKRCEPSILYQWSEKWCPRADLHNIRPAGCMRPAWAFLTAPRELSQLSKMLQNPTWFQKIVVPEFIPNFRPTTKWSRRLRFAENLCWSIWPSELSCAGLP